MASQLRISADTSEAKKSILELSKTVKDVKSSEISIFTQDDKRFIKRELNKEITLMKDKLKDNQKEITKLVAEQKKLKVGSDAELRNRDRISKAYKTQTRLAKELAQTQKASGQMGMGGQIGGAVGGLNKGLGGMLGKAGGILAAGTAAIGALGLPLAVGSAQQFAAGGRGRVRATGLGIEERTRLTPESIAEAGMTEQQLLERRTRAAAIAGRGAGEEGTVLQQARFERAFGLEEGMMTNVLGGLRGAFGAQADETQAKLQASVMASGMEDAIGPYLETMTTLLSTINENGMQNTDQLINAVSQLSVGERTPEQVARTFQNVDQSVRGAGGEASAFLQMAMARGGIGGGTIGGTRFAMESGGIMGLNREELEGRGFNTDLLNNMGRMGMFGGMGQRTGAIVEQFRRSAGLREGQAIGDVSDPSQMIALSNLANNIFGTQGMGGFDALQMMEKVQNKEMSEDKFREKLKEIKEKDNPQLERLSAINNTLAGQTTILTDIKTNLMESIGREAIDPAIQLQRADVARVRAQGEVIKSGAGAVGAGIETAADAMDYISKGKLGEDLYDAYEYVSDGSLKKDIGEAFDDASDWVKGLFGGGDGEVDPANLPSKEEARAGADGEQAKKNADLQSAVKQGMIEAQNTNKPVNAKPKTTVNVRNIMPDGKVTNKTYKSD